MTDVRLINHGTIMLFCLESARAQEWVRDNVQHEPWQRLGDNLAVDPRYADELCEGMLGAGLEVA